MSDDAFGCFQRLNALVDIWIDEEAYDHILGNGDQIGALQLADPVSKESGDPREQDVIHKTADVCVHKVIEYLNSCFAKERSCTRQSGCDSDWSRLWGCIRDLRPEQLPALWHKKAKVRDIVRAAIEQGMSAILVSWWQYLFLAKLIRAKIQQRGTDCYFSRLDDVVALLEANLVRPYQVEQAERRSAAKLLVLHLLELSAAAEGVEQLGFAERAERVMRNGEYLAWRCDRGIRSEQCEDDPFCEYYFQAKRYSAGVAFAHTRHYDDAVSEYDQVIYELIYELGRRRARRHSDVSKNRRRKRFPVKNLWRKFVYLPAVLARAEALLKQQLPYHALDTLQRYLTEAQESGDQMQYVNLKASLIRAEAYLRIGRFPDSLRSLEEVSEQLLGVRLDLIGKDDWLAALREPHRANLKVRLAGLLVDFFIAMLEGIDVRGEDGKGNWGQIHPLLKTVNERLLPVYFELAQGTELDRGGFYQQSAKYLAWLGRCGNVVDSGEQQQVWDLAWPVYVNYAKQLAPQDESQGQSCPYCEPKDKVNFARLRQESYDEIKEGMLDFYRRARGYFKGGTDRDLAQEAGCGTICGDEKSFIEWILDVEKNNRADLRYDRLDLLYLLAELSGRVDARCRDCQSGSTSSDFQGAFGGLLVCASTECSANAENCALDGKDYAKIIGSWTSRFLDQLQVNTLQSPRSEGVHLIGLQRWNSSSPAQGQSLGGGYLLYATEATGAVALGVAIDPGFDFVRNLLHMGFSVSDIDVVLISHSHVDHCRDLESMIILLGELKKQTKGEKKRKLQVVLTKAVYSRVRHLVDNPFYRELIEPYVIDLDRDIDRGYYESLPAGRFCLTFEPALSNESKDENDSPLRRLMALRLSGPRDARFLPVPVHRKGDSGKGDGVVDGTVQWLEIRPTRAYHNDHSNISDCFGFIIGLKLKGRSEVLEIGYTGDTKYVSVSADNSAQVGRLGGIGEQYGQCTAVLIHLGSLVDVDSLRAGQPTVLRTGRESGKDNVGKSCEELIRKKNHPYLPGLLRLLRTIGKGRGKHGVRPLILISEFGEELRGGIRADLIKRLQTSFRSEFSFLPLDVGVDVLLWENEGSNRQAQSGVRKGDRAGREQSEPAKVRCAACGDFVPVDSTTFQTYGDGVDEGLFCLCVTCARSMPLNVRQERLRRLCEVGHEMRAAPDARRRTERCH